MPPARDVETGTIGVLYRRTVLLNCVQSEQPECASLGALQTRNRPAPAENDQCMTFRDTLKPPEKGQFLQQVLAGLTVRGSRPVCNCLQLQGHGICEETMNAPYLTAERQLLMVYEASSVKLD